MLGDRPAPVAPRDCPPADPAPVRRRRPRRPRPSRSLTFTAAFVVGIGIYFLVSQPALVLILYPCFGLATAVCIVWGAGRRKPWLLIAGGTALFSLGDVVYNVYDARGDIPFPSPADSLYLSGYLVLAAGILTLMPTQRGQGRILGALDTTIITVAAGSYAWIFVIVPAAESSGSSLSARLVGGAYPVMDLLLLAFLVRLVVSGILANQAVRLLGVGLFFLLATDTAFYGWWQPQGLYLNHSYADLGWLVSYLFCGLAGLHRSARDEVKAQSYDQVGNLRLVALAAALLSGPLILLIELRHAYDRPYAYELALPLTILLFLVFGRMAFGIRERQGLLDELSSSEQHFRSLIEHSSDAISVIDREGRYIYQSPSIVNVFGYQPEERMGKPIFDYVAPANRRQIRQLLESLVDGQTIPSITLRAHHKQGHEITLDCSVSVRYSDPSVRGIIINSHDITARNQLEGQLTQAQKMEAVGQLAGGVAHDFNNILQAIYGYTELALLDPDDQAEVVEALTEIQSSASRAASISRQLLDFSRAEGKDPRPVDIGAAIADVTRLIRHLIGEQIEVAVAAPAGLGLVLIDPGQLEQVSVNLAVNARDAMPQGGRLAITLQPAAGAPLARHPELATGDYLELAFADRGHGMDETTLAHLFEPFYTTKEIGKGTGLGLATSYGIVKSAGGAIDVESELDVGTTFRVLLPIAAAALAVDAAAPDSGSAVSAQALEPLVAAASTRA